MMKTLLSVLCMSTVWMFVMGAQTVPVGSWQTYTAMEDVRDGARLDALVLGATSGGLFRYDRTTTAFSLTTNADGLSTNDLTAVGTDAIGRVWVGGAGGEVHVVDMATGTISDIMDIAQSPRLQKAIKAFVSHRDTVFIVSEFGVSVFRTDKWEFGDTYANFPIPVSPGLRDAVVFRDSLWIASASGLLVGSLSSTNLSAPSSWNVLPAAGMPSTDTYALVVHRDTLYAATSSGVGVNDGTGFRSDPTFAGLPVQKLIADGGQLVALSVRNGRSYVYPGVHAFVAGTPISPEYVGLANDVVFDVNAGAYWLMTPNVGMIQYTGTRWEVRNPDVPRISAFFHVAVDRDGVVWAGSGINGGGRGFARFAPANDPGEQWKTFANANHPLMASDDYYKANPVGNGSVWISSWGVGVVEVKGDSIVRKIDTQTTPAVASSVPSSQTFAVIGGIVEHAGEVWMVNRTAANGNVLARLLPDGTMTYEKNLLPGGEGRFTSMTIDRNGTKWLANSEPTAVASTGLYFFNEDMLVEGTSATGGWGQLTANDGLANNSVFSVVVDQDGDLWVGTDLGVSIFTNPRTPRSRRLSSFPLREQSIQSIAVDALNRKWAGTKEGVFVVSPDGSRLLEHYTVSNTNGALVDNDVRSIAIDQERGIVYMGTEKGLSALWIAAVAVERSTVSLTVAPNPFVVPSDGSLSIRSLVANSTIKIVAIDGHIVSQFEAQGAGRAFWDGKDDRGTYVGSGVYLIIAFAENGEQVTHGKVVVIRR